MVNILILAAGQFSLNEGNNSYPIYLTELNGVSLIERIIDISRSIKDANYLFVFLEKEAERFHLDKIASLLVPDSKVVLVPEWTRGSACTALFAACQIPVNNELLIISANELIDIDLSEVIDNFRKRNLDGGTLIFRSIHPRYSYVRLNDDGFVTEVMQQNPISKNATTGLFWFREAGCFVEAVKQSIRKNSVVEDKFYVALAFNEMILKQKNIGVVHLDTKKYRPLKTEQQLQNFEQGS